MSAPDQDYFKIECRMQCLKLALNSGCVQSEVEPMARKFSEFVLGIEREPHPVISPSTPTMQ